MFENPQLIISILSLIVAIGGAIAAYIYFRRTRKYKELAYEISPTASLVKVGEAVRDRVVITYQTSNSEGGDTKDIENIDITNLEAVTVTIHSTGTEGVQFPTSASPQVVDMQTPVTIDFGQDAHILGEPSAETNPKGRRVRVGLDPTAQGRVLMDRFLLNPKESITISTFLTGFAKAKPDVDWHIENVRPPRELKRERSRFADLVPLATGVLITIVSSVMLNLFGDAFFESTQYQYILPS